MSPNIIKMKADPKVFLGSASFLLFIIDRFLEMVIVGAEAFEGGTVKFFPVVGMSYADYEFGTLLKGLSVEIDGTVFGNEPVDVVSGCHYACSGVEYRRDFADSLVRD